MTALCVQQKESRGEGGDTGGDDLVSACIGEEGDSGQIGGLPVGAQVKVDLQGSDEGRRHDLEFAKETHHRCVLEGLARILAGADVGLKVFFGDSQPQVEMGVRQRCCRVEPELEGARVWF